MRRLLLLIAVLLTTFSFAQVQMDILHYNDSTEIYIDKGRSLINDRLVAMDLSGAIEVYNYLYELAEEKKKNVYSLNDRLSFYFLTAQFDSILAIAKDVKLADENRYFEDYLYYYNYHRYSFSYLIRDRYKLIDDAIDRQIKNDEDGSLLRLLVYDLYKTRYDEKYKRLYHNFKKEYSNSHYQSFVAKHLRNPIQVQYYYLALGGGTIFLDGNLEKEFTPEMLFNFDLGMNIEKVHVSFHLLLGKLISDQSFNATSAGNELIFDENERFSYTRYAGNFGYVLLNNRFVSVVPYVSIGGSKLESDRYSSSSNNDSEDEGNQKEYNVYHSFVCGPGVKTIIKLYSKSQNNGYGGLASLQINFGYDFLTTNRYDQYKSNMPYVSVGLSYGLGIAK